jgi:NADPH-dependent F420 reductase
MGYDASTLPDVTGQTVGILGGTGDQGRGLAYRLARAGQPILIGSRSAERAAEAAAQIRGLAGLPADADVAGAGNLEVAFRSDIVVVAVPWDGHAALLTELRDALAGKVVVDCVNPLGFDKQGPYALPVEEGSAAQQAAALLPDSRVCAAFNHVSAPLLADPKVDRIDLDVLICTEERELIGIVAALAARIPGMRGVYAGRLRNAHQVEAFTANLIAINKRYKAHAGIRVTDV